ncbi:hypothetical protein TWF970_004388 [Orbilia oligospora]|uniref:Uncharacterized protein n=1 Tax=Orbilia oligospora TaxID=2813651 RepID=A0A7C8VF07_ORBOL|nr:hypothetical protein TWF970_004388 [Orbilia oligospora]
MYLEQGPHIEDRSNPPGSFPSSIAIAIPESARLTISHPPWSTRYRNAASREVDSGPNQRPKRLTKCAGTSTLAECSHYITTWDTTSPCTPCNDFLIESSISQAEFIDLQFYNRNVTHFLQATKEFDVEYDDLPVNVGQWAGLPNHIRFTVNGQGTLIEGIGLENHILGAASSSLIPDGDDGAVVPDEGDLSDSNSTLVGSGSSPGSEVDHNEVLGGFLDGFLPVIREEEEEEEVESAVG